MRYTEREVDLVLEASGLQTVLVGVALPRIIAAYDADKGRRYSEDVPLAGALLLDANVASLGEDRWETVVYNNENVVAELRLKYTDEQIAVGRKQFLSGLLAKRTVYLSEFFGARFEQPARRNLTRLVRAL